MPTEVSRPREACVQCGFDSDVYDRADTISSQRIVPAVIEAATAAVPAPVRAERPDAATWSIDEYIDHVREMAFANRFVIEVALADPGTDLGDPPVTAITDQAKELDTERALAGVYREYEALGQLLESLSPEQWELTVVVGGERKPVGWFARHVLHDGLHHMSDIGRICHRLGHGAPTETGRLVQLNASTGGVPKLPRDSVFIEVQGLRGDRQADRRHHGRPVQAVSLWSADVIAALQAEGHPISAGNAGENVTVEGIAWDKLRPGSRLDIGSVPLLVTAHAIPCAKNAQWFNDRDFNRILHDRHPGSSRLYALPLASGQVHVGDPVIVEPASSTRSGE